MQVFHVPGRCFPVDVVHTVEDHTHDYVDAAVDAVLQLHTSQPAPGDILVFLTGQAEIEKALAKLEQGVASLDAGSCAPLLLLPLYASLPPEMQVRTRCRCARCARAYHLLARDGSTRCEARRTCTRRRGLRGAERPCAEESAGSRWPWREMITDDQWWRVCG